MGRGKRTVVTISPIFQSYPPPVELPAMRAGETDGRFMDCSPALAPVGDIITDLSTVSVTVTRQDSQTMGANDLQPAGGAWESALDSTGMVVTLGWIAPVSSAGVTYLLTLSVNTTREGRVFIRDWIMSVLPLMG
jgi:hypothetical protein